MSAGTFTIVALVVIGFIAIAIYNRLIALRNRNANAFSQIEVQLQRRYELIPNLVETAKAYMAHESETLTAVINARNEASSSCEAASKNPETPSLVSALASAEGALAGAMGRLSVVMEAYPDIKADAQMRDLSEELASTENRVTFARQAYSDAVMLYNTAREQFPMVIIAKVCLFKEADSFEADDLVMKKSVKVAFA